MADPGVAFCDGAADLTRALAALLPYPLAVVGIGNPLRGDDGFGPAVISALRPSDRLHLFDVQGVPESFLVPIVESGCGGVLFVDAADLGAEAGRVAVVPAGRLSEVTPSTHAVALSLVAEAVAGMARESRGCEVVCVLVGAQPSAMDEADRLSPAIEQAVRRVSEGIQALA